MEIPAPVDPLMAKLVAIDAAVQLFAATIGGMFGTRETANAMVAHALVLSGAELDSLKAHARVQTVWAHLLNDLRAEANAARGGESENIVPFAKPANTDS